MEGLLLIGIGIAVATLVAMTLAITLGDREDRLPWLAAGLVAAAYAGLLAYGSITVMIILVHATHWSFVTLP